MRFPIDAAPYVAAPTGGWTPGYAASVTAPPTMLGRQIQPFDPYAMPNSPPAFGLPLRPQVAPPSSGPPAQLPMITQPPVAPGTVNWPNSVLPGAADRAPSFGTSPPPPLGGSIYGSDRFGQPPSGPIQQSPVFPNGFNWNRDGGPFQRFFQDTGFKYTFLNGIDDDDDEADELEMHEVEISTTAVFQRFARSPYGLRVSPGFIFHFMDGPQAGGDIPPNLYSAFVNAAMRPQITPQFAADVRFRAGVYSDFDSVTKHSVRFTGHGLGIVQLTPNTALKLGVEYFDRLRIKLLPAGGVYWQPDAYTQIDLYFPRPKFSRYWRRMNNREVWWHIGAEYGGGSWTIDREDVPLLGLSDRIDINDVRIVTGIDWNYLDQQSGFLEIGYVFDREVIFYNVPGESMGLDDTFMVRGGLSF